MARWFKHSVLASQELPVRDIYVKYSFHGIGVFWTMYERVWLNEGTLTIGDLVRMFRSRHFGADAVRDLVLGFGCFKVDARGRVSAVEDLKRVVLIENDAQAGLDTGLDTESNARTREEEEKNREDNITPIPPQGDAFGGKRRCVEMRMAEEWLDGLKAAKGREQYCEVVCMTSGFTELLYEHWEEAVEFFRQHLIGQFENQSVVSQSGLYQRFRYFVQNEVTRDKLLAYLLGLAKVEKDTDYMSTYTGPPLSEDAPPRPSHTAVYNANRNEWVEPRGPLPASPEGRSL